MARKAVDLTQLVEATAADLNYLATVWGPSVDDHELRRTSPILRRFLAQGELQRAWKAAGFEKQPKLRYAPVERALGRTSAKDVALCSAGGVEINGIHSQSTFHVKRAMSLEEMQAHQAALGPPEDAFVVGPLNEFSESHCMVVDGMFVARREVVKFVGNKLGGAHYDEKRASTAEERVFVRLDSVLRGIELVGKNPVYYELLAIGQAINASEDLQRFRERVTDS